MICVSECLDGDEDSLSDSDRLRRSAQHSYPEDKPANLTVIEDNLDSRLEGLEDKVQKLKHKVQRYRTKISQMQKLLPIGSWDEESSICIDHQGSIKSNGEIWIHRSSDDRCARCSCQVRLDAKWRVS